MSLGSQHSDLHVKVLGKMADECWGFSEVSLKYRGSRGNRGWGSNVPKGEKWSGLVSSTIS